MNPSDINPSDIKIWIRHTYQETRGRARAKYPAEGLSKEQLDHTASEGVQSQNPQLNRAGLD